MNFTDNCLTAKQNIHFCTDTIDKSSVFCKNRPLLLAKPGISVYNKSICNCQDDKICRHITDLQMV